MILPLIWPNLNKKTARDSQDDTKQTIKPSAGEQLLLWYVHAQSNLQPRNHALDSDQPKMMLWLYITRRTHTSEIYCSCQSNYNQSVKIKCHVVLISLVILDFFLGSGCFLKYIF